MASSPKQISIFFFLLLTLSSSFQILHARDSQFFNKIPSNNSNNNNNNKEKIPQQEEPNFTFENENGYGLYGHESGQLPPSATTPTTVNGREPYPTTTNNNNNDKNKNYYYASNAEGIPNKKYLPKNYNPVAYVTAPEDGNDDTKEFATAADNRRYYSGEKESTMPDDTFTTTTNNQRYNYNGGRESKMPDDTRFMDKEFTTAAADNRRYYNGGRESSMPDDDTRLMDNEFTTTSTADDHQYYRRGGGGGRNYYKSQESNMPQDKFMESDESWGRLTNHHEYNNYPTTTSGRGTSAGDNHFNYNNGATGNRFQQQGMSDTRFMENGKYYYDVSNDKYARNPYENSRNFAGNSRNQFNDNFMENSNYKNVDEFQDADDMP